MTVRELIESLQKCPPDVQVIITRNVTHAGSSWTGAWDTEEDYTPTLVNDLETRVVIDLGEA